MTSTWIKAALACTALVAAPVAASAADMPIKGPRSHYKAVPSAIAYYNWTGFYAGVVAGYGFGSSDWNVPAVSTSPKGWNIGGTLGYNLQVGSFVYGIEGDLAWSNVSGSTTVGATTVTTENDYLATVRGRLGYSFDRFLPYLTGGLAYGDVKTSITPAGLSSSKSKLGWTIGGGLEYAFMGNWTAKLEYLYVDLGNVNPGFAVPATTSVSFDEHLVRVGLNYKFSGPVFSRF
jgi:outer membrane immunogenic protein